MKKLLVLIIMALGIAACNPNSADRSQSSDTKAVNRQQAQYAISQPVPGYDYSLERDLLVQLYNIRNQKVSTHSVWRSNTGMIEGDCTSMAFGLPYDTSLTNPLTATDINQDGRSEGQGALTSIGQPEPNGIFASTNTAATWVFCLSGAGIIEPVYVETKVTVYPGPVDVDYVTNRVVRTGAATVTVTPTAQSALK